MKKFLSNRYNVDNIKYSFINQAHWTSGDNLNIAIGQGTNSYTVLQMANYAATIANYGYKRNVSIIKDIKTYDGQKTDYEPIRESERIELKDYNHSRRLWKIPYSYCQRGNWRILKKCKIKL